MDGISEMTSLKAVIVEESVGDCQTSSATCHLVQPLLLPSQVLFVSGLILTHPHRQQSRSVHLLLQETARSFTSAKISIT